MGKRRGAPLSKVAPVRGAPLPFPFLSPRVGAGVGVRVGVGLGLVYLVLEYEVFREEGLRSRNKILCSDWSPPLLVQELAFRHAAFYVKSYVETFLLVKVTGKYVIQT